MLVWFHTDVASVRYGLDPLVLLKRSLFPDPQDALRAGHLQSFTELINTHGMFKKILHCVFGAEVVQTWFEGVLEFKIMVRSAYFLT